MRERYTYPAVFSYADDGISVEFPDLVGALTCGDTVDEAIKMAQECMGLHLYGMEKDEDVIPNPSDIRNIKLETDQSIVLISVWMPLFRDNVDNYAKKVTTTIPQWLKKIADENNVNYSAALQRAIKEQLGIRD